MVTNQLRSWRVRTLALLCSTVALALVVAVLLSIRSGHPGSHGNDPASPSVGDQDETAPPLSALGSTRFRVSSFNLLGAGHTRPGGDTPGYASGEQRMVWSVQLLAEQNIDLVGMQEMRPVQYDKFMSLTKGTWGIYPGNKLSDRAMANSIAWRRDMWALVEANTVNIPYFNGNEIPMPYIKLRNVYTGQLVFIANFHNPADKFGDAEQWRREATRRQIALANRLRAENPGVPVFFTGDFNERETYFCRLVGKTDLRAANGGWVVDGVCQPPARMPVDWIFGSRVARLSGYVKLRDALVEKITDHPVIISNAAIPPSPVLLSPIRHVVVLSVEGLTSRSIERLGEASTPALHRLMREGSSTLSARTVRESTLSLPNAVSMLSGRRVNPTYDGHGIRGSGDDVTTVHEAAGHYVSSVFDIVHNDGRITSLFAGSKEFDLIDRTWDAAHGGVDRYWVDNGTDKLTHYLVDEGPRSLVPKLRERLATHPSAYTFAQLSLPDLAGHEFGWSSEEYLDAVSATDRQIRRIRRTITDSTRLNGRTLLVVTSEHGGLRHSHEDAKLRRNARIPFIVWGPGVPAGQDLYAMNPHLVDPDTSVPWYTGAQPIRNAYAANLALMALRLPALPGSTLNQGQDFNIFGVR